MKLFYTRTVFVLAFLLICATESRAQLVANFSGSPLSGCAPVLVTFTDASTGSPSTWDWNFGDGTGNSNLPAPSHNYATPGQYTVTLTIGNGTTTDVEVKTNYITVFANPVAGFNVVPDTICSGQSVTFTSTSTPGDGAITDYTWSFNDGNPSVTGNATISHIFNNSNSTLQTFLPVLLINDVNGCNSTISESVYVFPSPSANFSIGSITSCATPATVNFANASTGTTTFNWNFGDATSPTNTSTLATPSHTYNASGSYLVTLTAGVPGCNSIDTMTVNILQPIASFTVNDSTICRFNSCVFTNTSTPAGASILWNFGDPGSGINNGSTLPIPSHFYITPNTYTVTLTVSQGSCTSTSTMHILVRPNPSALFYTADNLACDTPFNVTFLDTVSNIATWSWTFGDAGSGVLNNATTQNPLHTFHTFGIYDIKLVVVDIYGCTDSLTRNQYIQVIKPVVDFTQRDSGCVGKTFNFFASVISPANPNIQSYVWNFGDSTGNFVGGPGISHQVNIVGIFDVTLTITTTDGCTATITKPGFIRTGTPPVANFSAAPLTVCFQQNVQFTDLTPQPVTGWSWSFGDGGGSIDQNPSHEYNRDTSTLADPFDITLIAYYNGCPDDTTIQNLIVVNAPIPNFSIAYNCSTPLIINFTNLSGGATSYVWDFGDLSPTETSTDPVHTYPASGDYNVTLTATSTVSGCVVDTILPVHIRVPSAVITFVGDSVACHAGTIHFSSAGSADISTLQWTFGEGIAGVRDTSYAADTLHLYQRPGYYTATLTISDINGCTVIQTKQVHIIGPTAGFTANPLGGCAPINVTFTDTSLTEGGAINQWVWNYGGGTADSTSSVGIVSHNYSTAGLYTITLTVTDINNCSDTHTSLNYINPSKPTAAITTDTTGCKTVGELFTATAGIAASPIDYIWDFGDGSAPSTVNTASTTHNYLSNGSYPIYLLIVDANGCRDSVHSNMFIYTTPASFTVTAIDSCVSENGIKKAQVIADFHVDTSLYAVNYNWNLSVFSNPTWTSGPNFHYVYNVPPGSYDATLILTNSFGCRDTATITGAVVVNGPTGSFSFTPSIGCSPLTVSFTGTASGANTFAWDFDDGNVINGTTQLLLNHRYTQADTFFPQFYLGFQLTNSFCYIATPALDSIVVTSLISANIDSTVICITDGGSSSVQVTVSDPSNTPPYTYSWTPGGFVSNIGSTATTADFVLATSGISQYYYVAVGYGSLGCAAFDSVRIDYCPCIDIIDSIPNVFTPNGDGRNDFYEMKALCYYEQFRIVIFNRWGKKMYESNNPYFRWDGKTEGGSEASEGVYYWIMDTKSGQLHGNLELIRVKN